MSKQRDDLLAETLDKAGILSPLLNALTEQLEGQVQAKSSPKKSSKSTNSTKELSVADREMQARFPDISPEELEELAQVF